MWVLSAFSMSGNSNVCVFCFGFFPLYKQLQKAILHLPTLELSIETAQTEKLQKNKKKNPYKKKKTTQQQQ